MLTRFWLDEGGAILSAELCLIMVLLVIGMVVGLTALRDAVDFQLTDIAAAIASIDPGYEFNGLQYNGICSAVGGNAVVNGSKFASTWTGIKGAGSGLITVIPASSK